MTVADMVTDPMAYPTRRDEAWRYAPHGVLGRLVFGPSPPSVEIPGEVLSQLPAVDGPRIVVVNGAVDYGQSNLAELPDGVEILALATALEQGRSDAERHMAGTSAEPGDAFAALNRTFGRDGAFIAVEEGTNVDAPIHVVHVTIPDATSVDGGQNGTCAGVVVRIGDGSTATVIETHVGSGPVFGGANVRSSVHLGPGATLTHLNLQDLPPEHVQLGCVDVQQATGSEFRGRSFNLGAAYGRVDYRVTLAGENATADLAGLYFGFGDQTLDQQITVTHAVENCVSRQSFRGVLDDQSTGVFNGGIMVSPGADGTDAEQANDNLLLSRQADVNTQPRLEILADDVACKHGATIGQLDETALYYLRSRGIPFEEARRLLIAGFAEQTVDEIRLDAVRGWITERLGHRHA